MKLLDRLFRPAPDDQAEARPLWLGIIAEARSSRWYAELGVADSVEGRFDMVTLILALVLLRLEREPGCETVAVRLTELFVDDMDAQLRQSGVGDLMVGKHMGKLMAVLGGRIGALREALGQSDKGGDDAVLGEVIARNARLLEGAGPEGLAAALRALDAQIAANKLERLLAGDLTP